MTKEILKESAQEVFLDKKWKKLLKKIWLFKFIPGVDFVLVAGSLATGNVNKDSDFDVIVGAKQGRIFTARFLSVLFFGLFGWRRRKLSHKESARDKICLNHFITKKSYRLNPPYNKYWINLYRNLVPVFGKKEALADFFRANADWAGNLCDYKADLRHKFEEAPFLKKACDVFLNGKTGDFFESFFKKAQVRRIEKSLKNDEPGYKPRIVYNDFELEFHPDTKRTEEFTSQF